MKILFCPKCGNKGQLQQVGDYKQFYIVKCCNCDYTINKYNEACLTNIEAIKKWNYKVKQLKGEN